MVDEEIRIAASATSFKNIQDWAAKFEGAPLDIKKMILALMIERITVDRDYNIEIHFYLKPYTSSNVAMIPDKESLEIEFKSDINCLPDDEIMIQLSPFLILKVGKCIWVSKAMAH